MLVAALLLALGFLGVSYVTQTRGLRLGGTIVVPMVALYSLKNFVALPVFLVSTALAYAALWAAKEYTLVYGRQEFMIALLSGSLLPLGILFLGEQAGTTLFDARLALFLGSILPGLAAYNLQQIKPGYRRQDAGYAIALYLGLVTVGALLVGPRLAPMLGTHTPLVLFSATSDIAVLRGAVVGGELYPVIVTRSLAVGLLLVSLLVAEWGRARFGVRAGVVTMGLLAVYATASRWLVLLFLICFLVASFTIALIHTTTLFYGRVLVGLAGTMTAIVVIPLALTLPIVRGLSALIVAVLAAAAAYNSHVTPPYERRMRVPLALIVFTSIFLLARFIGNPYDRGLFADVATLPWIALLTLVIVVGSLLLLERFQVPAPSDDAVLSASILSGGEG
ncbi:poly-gamma-glutamate biosynthesis protein PgsC/CapC [Natronomonas sp. EA1]|uniref:poly-gamma-glutamate biosynthesis protein PgsC/CapC n=1 Tax=Natronomonas sp. EA1 TaxID=3421655 RepID=UPI003EBAC82D